jgi:RNase P/RNase MRP subunit p29
MGHQPSDTKLIRVRGPLANSSVSVNTYTAYIRPFYDEANNIGQVTLFSQPTTIYTLNGQTYVGNSGLDALSVLSAGSTMTAGFTTFQPDYNPLNGAYAGRFNLQYVVAGSTLEDVYTNGISGTVVARTGNTLTLRGSTIIFTTDDTFEYEVNDCQVLLGAGTIVTADDNPLLKNLNPSSIAVGDHITARGNYIATSTGACGLTLFGQAVELDSTGTTATNTGSVRLQQDEAFGTLVSSAAGSLVMDLTSIDYWPVAAFNFTGNGATPPVPAAFSVNTEGLALPAGTAPGDPIWLSGYAAYFGAAPPDYLAFAVNNELSVQTAGGSLGGGVPTTPGVGACGVGSQVCDPAVLQVTWTAAGSTTPFTSLTDQSFTIDLADPAIASAIIQIGSESILMSSLPASPMVVPTTLATTETFAPRYSWGNPVTSTATESVPTSTTNLALSSVFSDFVSGVTATLGTADPALQLMARGIYDRTTNTFTATQIDFAL